MAGPTYSQVLVNRFIAGIHFRIAFPVVVPRFGARRGNRKHSHLASRNRLEINAGDAVVLKMRAPIPR